jgi:ectonucleotide pyrophosphatase/phosphodiesterase family protein 1/3
MGALFIGVGPRFAVGKTVPATDNIHVYNLMCALLGVVPAENEGDDRLVKMLVP